MNPYSLVNNLLIKLSANKRYHNYFADIKCFNKEIEDFDSGCSSMPSSPSNLSDLSGTSYDDCHINDLVAKKINILDIDQDQMAEDAIINPHIKIMAENDVQEDFCTCDDLLPRSDDLLGMLMNGYELFIEDSSTFDNEKAISMCDVNSVEKVEINVQEQPVLEQSSVGSICRKRTMSSRKNVNDHTYACEKISIDDSFNDNKESAKDDSYLEKRRRNNLAAKKSRQLKRAKEIDNLKSFEKLSKENKSLLKELKKLQSLVSKLENKLKHS